MKLLHLGRHKLILAIVVFSIIRNPVSKTPSIFEGVPRETRDTLKNTWGSQPGFGISGYGSKMMEKLIAIAHPPLKKNSVLEQHQPNRKQFVTGSTHSASSIAVDTLVRTQTLFSPRCAGGKQRPNQCGDRYKSETNGDWGDPHTGSQSTTGGRDYCPEVEQGIVALIPQTNWGQTISTTPTLWFYVPYNSDQIAYGEFILLDETGIDHIAPIRFTVADAGLVSITLPLTEFPLKPKTDYNWAFQLYCSTSQTSPLNLEGWLQQTVPSAELTAALATDPLDYQAYWQAGIWFDALDALMQQRRVTSTDTTLNNQWQILLEDGGIGLSDAITVPIVGPVQR